MEKKLFWAETGAIACEKHAPMRGSDTWQWDAWREITPLERVALAAAYEPDASLDCETCSGKPLP